jgi:hypothetical protein
MVPMLFYVSAFEVASSSVLMSRKMNRKFEFVDAASYLGPIKPLNHLIVLRRTTATAVYVRLSPNLFPATT